MTEEEQVLLDGLKSVRLCTSPERASNRLQEEVAHRRFLTALGTHWKCEGQNLAAESKCWLFCWAETGMGSEKTASKCRKMWNELFDKGHTYEWFAANVGPAFARSHRYDRRKMAAL